MSQKTDEPVLCSVCPIDRRPDPPRRESHFPGKFGVDKPVPRKRSSSLAVSRAKNGSTERFPEQKDSQSARHRVWTVCERTEKQWEKSPAGRTRKS